MSQLKETKPLNSFKELLNYVVPDKNFKIHNLHSKRFYQYKCGLPVPDKITFQTNKVLFCHDMKGGYLDDCKLESNRNINAYRFYHWHLIDIFVYFSHHFVTIPPRVWIKLCEKHGVKCYGTIIIEPGEKEGIFAELLDNIEVGSSQLTKIKEYWGLDGWLVNIECESEGMCGKVAIRKLFVFLDVLRTMGNEIIWYDAITVEGKLEWQNELNERNCPFYQHSGRRIFTNYGWNKEHLARMHELCLAEGFSNGSVYVGVDCFGRGCLGGGGMNVSEAVGAILGTSERGKDENVCTRKTNKLIRTNPFSIALFAAGWTHESVPCDAEVDVISHNVWQFYNNIETLLLPRYVHDNTEEVDSLYRALPPSQLLQCDDTSHENITDFITNFNLGQSTSQYDKGQIVVRDQPYNFMMQQQYFPTGLSYETADEHKQGNMMLTKKKYHYTLQILPDQSIAYNGHGCAKVCLIENECYMHNNNVVSIDLFRLTHTINPASQFIIIIGYSSISNSSQWMASQIDICINYTYTSVTHVHQQQLQMKQINLILANDNYEIMSITNDNSSQIEWRKYQLSNLVDNDFDNVCVRMIKLSVHLDNYNGVWLPLYLGHLRIVT